VKPEDVVWYRDVLRLKATPRTGWLHRGVPRGESVADHSFATAALAWRVARRVPGVDAARVVLMCLLHDLVEARLGDIPSPAKPYLGKDALAAAERAIERDQWPDDAETRGVLEELAAGESAEARLAHALDHLELLLQARAYRDSGHPGVEGMLRRAKDGAAWRHPATRAWVEQLLAE
jgi:putative hydrolase of HD superfamily